MKSLHVALVGSVLFVLWFVDTWTDYVLNLSVVLLLYAFCLSHARNP